ncbi:hypothetical protein LJR066_000605 [Acidovorax sp. LjRoot66]|uniref:hypothetical protein n=1 Tax=Acidovorax sp. LjRoot66 TaxID=3342334 RepID=UPI003ED04D2D
MKKAGLRKKGDRTNTVPGVKPKVAADTELAAKINIEKKVHLLLSALKEFEKSADPGSLKDLPRTTRQFNMWEVRDSKGLQVTRNSRLTLLRYPDLKLSAEGAMTHIEQHFAGAKKYRRKSENLASARRSGALQKEMRQICERELVKARFQKEEALRNLHVAEERYKSLEKEHHRFTEELRSETENLRDENKRLTQAVRKITGIRSL